MYLNSNQHLIICGDDNAETKEKVVASLGNFAYDPYNYTFFRQVCVFIVFGLVY